MPSTCFSNDETDTETIKQRNEKYLEVKAVINIFTSAWAKYKY